MLVNVFFVFHNHIFAEFRARSLGHSFNPQWKWGFPANRAEYNCPSYAQRRPDRRDALISNRHTHTAGRKSVLSLYFSEGNEWLFMISAASYVEIWQFNYFRVLSEKDVHFLVYILQKVQKPGKGFRPSCALQKKRKFHCPVLNVRVHVLECWRSDADNRSPQHGASTQRLT